MNHIVIVEFSSTFYHWVVKIKMMAKVSGLSPVVFAMCSRLSNLSLRRPPIIVRSPLYNETVVVRKTKIVNLENPLLIVSFPLILFVHLHRSPGGRRSKGFHQSIRRRSYFASRLRGFHQSIRFASRGGR